MWLGRSANWHTIAGAKLSLAIFSMRVISEFDKHTGLLSPVEYKVQSSPTSDKKLTERSYARAKWKRDVKIHSPRFGMTNKWEKATSLLPVLSRTVRH